MPYDSKRVGRRIASLRVDKGWDQPRLASESNVSPSSIARYESGAITMGFDVACRMADALDCTLDQLACKEGGH